MASRYEPLGAFLSRQAGDRVPLTFKDVEAALGFALPNSKCYPAWWSNNPSNNPMTKVWLEAGFVTEQVDTSRERLVFRRSRRRPGEDSTNEGLSSGGRAGWLKKLRKEMAGTVQVEPGWDLTNPTGEVWDAESE